MWAATFVQPVSAPAELKTIPAPVGGLNYLDPLANMPETDALRLLNWFPQAYGCEQRKGYREWATGLGSGGVETLAATQTTTGVRKMYGWCGDKVYDVSVQGVVGAALVTGLSYARWQYVNLVNSAGAHLVCFNGVDNGIVISNGTVNRLVAGDGVTPYTWSGVNPADLIQCTVHQKRLWAVQKNTSLGWYLPAGAIYGAAQSFDFGPQFKRGGYLVGLATWSVDDGGGSDDRLVALSSNGDLVVYSGINVSDPNAWKLVGTYYVGHPVKGYRYFTNIGGDLYITTDSGILSLNSLLSSGDSVANPDAAETRKIRALILSLIQEVGQSDDWELQYFPQNSQLYLNIPSTSGGNKQVVQNLNTKAWCTFEGYDAVTWESFDSKLFFGGRNGKVYQAWSGGKDNVLLDGTGGTEIISQVLQAYSYLGSPVRQKAVSMYRPNFVIAREVAYNSQVKYDFDFGSVAAPSALAVQSGSLWGSAVWGSSYWGGSQKTQRQWEQGEGMGVAVSLAMSVTGNGDLTWVSTDYVFKSGGVLG